MKRARPSPSVLAVVLVAACAAPSRQLTSRVVEDPVTLPRRMASVTLAVGPSLQEPRGTRDLYGERPRFHFGITDRLEWTDLAVLTYAFLDDAPAAARRAPLSLAVGAGIQGFGVSTAGGLVLEPTLGVGIRKHVADRWSLGLGLNDSGEWTQEDVPRTFADHRWSTLNAGASVLRQISSTVAAGIAGGLFQSQDCLTLTCTWRTRGGRGQASVIYRPRHWLTVSVTANAVFSSPHRIPVVQDPTEPIVTPPGPTTTLIGIVGAAFYW